MAPILVSCERARLSLVMRLQWVSLLLVLSRGVAFVPGHWPSLAQRMTPRFAHEELVLCDESVEAVLDKARTELESLFGYVRFRDTISCVPVHRTPE